ncbi:MAG: hypothetical protein HXY28_00140 [Hydrogenophilaceae bacterium]|jgi:hypothetical protein|nr:hypothetical protein [Hydrogenophilaceae bacterium]
MYAHDLQKMSLDELSAALADKNDPSKAANAIIMNEFARRAHIAQIESANATRVTAVWTRWIAVANLVLMATAVITLILAVSAPR